MNRLGRIIELKRKSLGLTRKQLAARLGIKPDTLRDIEYGANVKYLHTLIPKIASSLGMSISELYGVTPPPQETISLAIKIRQLADDIISKCQGF